jgi:adenylate kinase family enzyme
MEQRIPNINNLHNEKNVKEKIKTEAYILVLNKCIEKIIYTNKHTDQTYIFFDVPRFLIDYPFYDMNSCVMFIMNKLVPNNYTVSFIAPFYLYIDWSTQVMTSKIPDKLRLQTKELLKKYPDTTKIVYEYTDTKPTKPSSSKKKVLKKKK